MENNLVDTSALAALEIGLVVQDIGSMKRFYCEGLGFQPWGIVELPQAHIEAFRFGNCLLKLTLYRKEDQRPTAQDHDNSISYITLRVRSIHDAVQSCLSAGGRSLIPTTMAETQAGQSLHFAFVIDPMGNRVELVEGNAWTPCAGT